jgi:hypothetical protein
MMRDRRGLEVTCDSAAALEAIDGFASRMVALARGTEAIVPAAAEHADTPMLQLYAAAAYLFAQTGDGDRKADGYLDRAAALAPRANPREERWRAALGAWRRHDFSAAAALLEGLTEEWPADLAAAKVCEFLYYVLGQQHEAARFRRHMERLLPYHDSDPDLLAMLAFACELTGDCDAAHTAAERAIAARGDNPWADHALAHVWIRRGEIAPAIAHLEAALPRWDTCSSIIRAHDVWHLALFRLETLDFDAALALLDRAIWSDACDEVGFAVDAVSLLWRIEMAGRDCGVRWPGIAERIECFVEPCFMPFLSAHLAYALARGGRAASLERLLASVVAESRRDACDARRAWSRAGKALVDAAAAFGAGDVRECAVLLEPIRDELTVGGGSDAQCDLFRLTLFRSLAACGRRDEARRVLERTLAGKAPTPLDGHFAALAA